jgi:hypothetical protein
VAPGTAGEAVITDDHRIRSHLSVILGAAARAADFNRAAVAVRPGVIAAVPVAAMLALGTIIDQPVAAVTMGVGAMLVGVAWRSGEGPATPPLGTMSAAASMLAFSTVVGTVTGRWPWLHLAVLFLFCLLAGAASAIGRRGVVVGTQTLIAFIVFGRFPESLIGGLRLAGLVLAGGIAQTLFAALVASPLAWRHQRSVLAGAYRQLAAIARQMTTSGVTAAEAFDAADGALATPALFGDPQLAGLVSLVAEGRRIRLELLVLSAALDRARARQTRADPSQAAGTVAEAEAALAMLAEVLELIAASLGGADPAALEAVAEELKRWSDAREPMGTPLLETRVAALGGQVRAAARQTAAVARSGGAGTWRLPHPRLGSRRRFGGVAADLQRIRDGASLNSPSGRHALRLAVVVAGTELLTQRLAIPRAYWAVVAAATVLRPNFGATFTRGAERVLGTVLGAFVATLIAVAIDPSGWGIVATIGILAVLTYTVFGASFAAGTAGLTAMIVFLLHAVSPDSATVALDRGLDTVIGGAIGLGAYVLWPTWSTDALPLRLSVLIGAQRDYLLAVFSGVLSGSPVAAPVIVPLARHVRIAYSDADASLVLARGEPPREADGLNAEHAAAALAALRRVTYGIHALRLASQGLPQSHPELSPLGDGLGSALAVIGERLVPDGGGPAPLPPLRELYRRFATDLGDGVGLALDELVDAVDSAAAALDA